MILNQFAQIGLPHTSLGTLTLPTPCPKEPFYYAQYRQKISSSPLIVATKLAQFYQQDNLEIIHSGNYVEEHPSLADNVKWQDYAIYEKEGEFSVGIGLAARITVYSDYVQLRYQEPRNYSVNVSFNDEQFQERIWLSTDIVRNISSALDCIPIKEWRAYGISQFELAHVFNNPAYHTEPGKVLMQFFIPLYEFRLCPGDATLRSLSPSHLPQLLSMLHQCDNQQGWDVPPQIAKRVIEKHIRQTDPSIFCDRVTKIVHEIRQGKYQKVSLSHKIPLPDSINLLASYQLGRINNAPARSYAYRIQGFELMGFSPKIMATITEEGWLSTQPLTGTWALPPDKKSSVQLLDPVLGNTKNIAEHALSVQRTFNALLSICLPNSITLSQYMAVIARGNTQYLASYLQGQIIAGINHWQAFQSLYPAVTAAGNPTAQALQAIIANESESRGVCGGSVLMIDSNGALDTTQVLPSLYHENNQYWLHAGVEIIDQSDPLCALEKTHEELFSIAHYLVPHPATID